MKGYHNTRSSRRSVKNEDFCQGRQELNAHAGLIQAVNFLMKHGFESKIEQTPYHQTGITGVSDEVYMILLPLVVIVVVACSIKFYLDGLERFCFVRYSCNFVD
jgi:hypothetical protein